MLARNKFLYHFKAGPAGGRLRRPFSRRQRPDVMGKPASPSTLLIFRCEANTGWFDPEACPGFVESCQQHKGQ
jgi:hypothetical protein